MTDQLMSFKYYLSTIYPHYMLGFRLGLFAYAFTLEIFNYC
jgi:hypothetical protein